MLAAARGIGYLPAAGAVTEVEPVRLDFVLPSGPNTFMDLLAAHLEKRGHARAAELRVQVHRVDGFSPEALASCLRALQGESDGVGDHRHRPSPRPRGDPRGGGPAPR